MTLKMLEEECGQFVETVIATPHFYAHRKSIEDFLEKRNSALADLRAELAQIPGSQPKSESAEEPGAQLNGDSRSDSQGESAEEPGTQPNGDSRSDSQGESAEEPGFLPNGEPQGESAAKLPQIRTGAEVYYFQGMGKAERLPDLCIEGTDTILVEMPFAQWTEHIYRDIREIITGRHLNVVLAHIERYPEFQKDHGPWEMIMALPLTTQINAGSFIKGRRRRKFCIDWIKSRPDSVLGSDCHNLDTRQPNLAPAREVIRKKAGAEVLERMDKTANKLLERA